jgi:hypothetical protein
MRAGRRRPLSSADDPWRCRSAYFIFGESGATLVGTIPCRSRRAARSRVGTERRRNATLVRQTGHGGTTALASRRYPCQTVAG